MANCLQRGQTGNRGVAEKLGKNVSPRFRQTFAAFSGCPSAYPLRLSTRYSLPNIRKYSTSGEVAYGNLKRARHFRRLIRRLFERFRRLWRLDRASLLRRFLSSHIRACQAIGALNKTHTIRAHSNQFHQLHAIASKRRRACVGNQARC